MQISPQKFLAKIYPECRTIFVDAPIIERLKLSDLPIPHAIVKVIIGQMLSRKAASTIYNRTALVAYTEGKEVWDLDRDQLRKCGLSNRKARAISQLKSYYDNNSESVNTWNQIEYEDFEKQICSIKGIGKWTANILALFYFANEDIFPVADGTLMRAMDLVKKNFAYEIDHERAKPFRSYLSLYLWQAIDKQIIKCKSSDLI